MINRQYYLEFDREMQNLKSDLYSTNTVINQDTHALAQHLGQLKVLLEQRNREIERKMSEMKKMLYQLIVYK
ncbi:MAG: hypothetical protein WCJ58_01445 [bacterium]